MISLDNAYSPPKALEQTRKLVEDDAGLENVQGILTTQFTKQAGDPTWAQDPEVIEYIAFMKKWAPNDSPNDFIGLMGYLTAQAIARALE